jgi:hypothetical protein
VHSHPAIRDVASRLDRQTDGMRWWVLKAVVNVVNLSTPFGLGVAALGRATPRPGPRGLVIATGYRLPVPVARAFTVGNVIVTRHEEGYLEQRPALLAHEERHSWQYVACLGLPMVPLYLVAAGWSYLRGGDIGVHNPFERLAGLADGGYPLVSARERARDQRRRASSTGPARRPRPA